MVVASFQCCSSVLLGDYVGVLYFVFFFKQKTAYEMRISDWSSDVCSSDLQAGGAERAVEPRQVAHLEDLRDAAPFLADQPGARAGEQIGRASCRERVCQYV